MTTEILYLARNRLEFTRVTFAALLANTDWTLVDRLVIYDDGSKDGTREWLQEAALDAPGTVVFRLTNHGSPVAIMCDYLETTGAEIFCKVDNDVALPPGWLPPALGVMERSPELDLLGLAAGWTGRTDGPTTYQACSHIGGVGLMRVEAFRRHPDLWGSGRQGFTQWQHRHTGIRSGWIRPDVAAVQLDLIPDEPWRGLAEYYRARGWARFWPPMDPANHEWWDWIPSPVTA